MLAVAAALGLYQLWADGIDDGLGDEHDGSEHVLGKAVGGVGDGAEKPVKDDVDALGSPDDAPHAVDGPPGKACQLFHVLAADVGTFG